MLDNCNIYEVAVDTGIETDNTVLDPHLENDVLCPEEIIRNVEKLSESSANKNQGGKQPRSNFD